MSRRSIHYRDGKSHPDNHARAVGTGRMQRTVVQHDGSIRKVPGINTGLVCSLPMKSVKAARIRARLPKKTA